MIAHLPDLRARRGMTLVEIMIAMVIGVVILGATMSFTLTTFRGVETANLREDIFRGGRFIGSSLERDLSMTGVAMRSQTRFGTLLAKGDTLVVVSVPFDSLPNPFTPGRAAAPIYAMPTGTAIPPLPGQGNCGVLCVDVQATAGDSLQFGVGSMVQMNVNAERRFLNVTNKQPIGSNRFRIEFAGGDTTFLHPAGWAPPIASASRLLLLPAQTTFQRITPVMYYRDNQNRLIRATRLTAGNAPIGDVVAENVIAFEVWLMFEDGDSTRVANPTDVDGSNDYDDLSGVAVRATLQATRPDLPGGVPATRQYDWRFSPRNLGWERNR
jgi:prepilin-type N-terminal cleavage/methylation domain-containing protein